MKIEKINENQIRCVLSKEELADRQIKISELAYGTDKAKSLFRDMIEQANHEFGFEADDIPLMIEAIPMSGENIVLQITKVEYPEELDTRFSRFSETEEENSKEEDLMFAENHGADDVLGMFPQGQSTQQSGEKTEVPVKIETADRLTKMYEFKSMEDLERLAKVIAGYYRGHNDVYKLDKTNRYYLFLKKGGHTPEEFNKVCNVISEYGVQKKYAPATEAFFIEHGKKLLTGNALEILESIG